MNTVRIKSEIETTEDGPRMSYLVVAVIDGNEVKTRHKFHTEANSRISFLCKHYDCKEI